MQAYAFRHRLAYTPRGATGLCWLIVQSLMGRGEGICLSAWTLADITVACQVLPSVSLWALFDCCAGLPWPPICIRATGCVVRGRW
jgi:hypothetical protein